MEKLWMLCWAAVTAHVVACHETTTSEAERSANKWLSDMHLKADGVSCDAASGKEADRDYNMCAVRFGSQTEMLWCKGGGCRMDGSFKVPATYTITEGSAEKPR